MLEFPDDDVPPPPPEPELEVDGVDDGEAADEDDVDDDDEVPELDSDFFELEYRSLYQPPPFNWNDVRDIIRSREPSALHSGHTAGAGSLTLCITSSSLPHF